ncbi:MAG TPA: heme o synthase [Tepidisphaeraceae bacterium]
MTTLNPTTPRPARPLEAVLPPLIDRPAVRHRRQSSDFVELTKLRLNVMVLITTAIGFALSGAAPGLLDWRLFMHTLLGTALCAAGASVLNQAWEWRLDRRMERTKNRPVAAGRMKPAEAAGLGLLMASAGTLQLALETTPLAALLAAATVALYVLVYTPLKTRTTLNTLVGAIPGAIPPLIGYTAGGAPIDALGWSLFAILFCWQMPHFLAIAVLLKDDYAAAGYRMLPITDTRLVRTGAWMTVFTLLLIAASLAPAVLRPLGVGYVVVATLLGVGFLGACIDMIRQGTRPATRRAFFASIIYLPLVLGALLIASK